MTISITLLNNNTVLKYIFGWKGLQGANTLAYLPDINDREKI
jgi:hypothetical protein